MMMLRMFAEGYHCVYSRTERVWALRKHSRSEQATKFEGECYNRLERIDAV